MIEDSRAIPPVFVLSSGRCGSTMLSNILNTHPDILSLSEFFTFHGTSMFRRRRVTGERMWEILSRQSGWTRFMLRGRMNELTYPLDTPLSRYSRSDLPPILCATLPHITERYEELFKEMEPAVQSFPPRSTADQLRSVFGWLCAHTGAKAWVERSGASAVYGATLLHRFPDARIVHMYRDGRDTALSMMRHAAFREMMVYILALRNRGYDPLKTRARRNAFWDWVALCAQPLIYALLLPRPVPYERLKPAHFGTMWSDMVARTCELVDRMPADRVLHVGFEDVLSEPEREIRRVVRFIDPGLEDDDWITQASGIPRPSPSRTGELGSGDLDALTEACRPGLERLGYQV